MTLSEPALQAIAARTHKLWDRFYVPAKLRSDPVYSAVAHELEGSDLPVLDVGCGIGLLAQYLRALGHAAPICGFDYDERKIASASAMTAGLNGMSFHVGDARKDLPAHLGHVVILDILQFFTPDEQEALLMEAARRVSPGGKLIIRSGLSDGSWRYRITVLGDLLARATAWMKAAPVAYPMEAQFQRVLTAAGLSVTLTPLWGSTPFNNYLIVATRPAA